MARLGDVKRLPHLWLFGLLFLANGCLTSVATMRAADRVLLPLVYPPARDADPPLRVVNNDGTLSDGTKLDERAKSRFFRIAGVAWAVFAGTTACVLIRVWPSPSEGTAA